jgi:hypothetical protein
MKIGKTVFAVLLTVFCLSMMIITAIPTRSSVGDYDPQLDINHDGVINMKDIGGVARSFSTSGDPTVPVNVTNWPESFAEVSGVEPWGFVNVSWSPSYSPFPAEITTNDYSRMYLYVNMSSAMYGIYNVTLRLTWIAWNYEPENNMAMRWESVPPENFNVPVIVNGLSVSTDYIYINDAATVTVKAPYCWLYFSVVNPTIPLGWVSFNVIAYLRNE